MGFRERLIEKVKSYDMKTTQKVVFASEVTVMLNEELGAEGSKFKAPLHKLSS